MTNSLRGQRIPGTFNRFLQSPDGFDGTLRQVRDGEGVALPMQASTSEVDTTFAPAIFTTAVPRSSRSRAYDEVSIRDFGALGDGTSPDDTTLAAAINASNAEFAAGRTLLLRMPPGKFLVTQPAPMFFRHGGLKGAGGYKSNIVLDPSMSGSLFMWSEAWISTDHPKLGPFADPATQKMGPMVEGISFWGYRTAANIQHVLDFRDRCDRVRLVDLSFENVRGSAIRTGYLLNMTQSYMRQSRWYDLRARGCGDISGVPTLDFYTDGGGDATNEIFVVGSEWIFSWGPTIRFRNNNPSNGMRRIFFFGTQVHGWDNGADAPANGDLVQIGTADSRTISAIEFIGLTLNSANAGNYLVTFDSLDDATMPRDCKIDGMIGNAAGGGFNINAGRNISIHLRQENVTETLLRVAATPKTGANIEWDAKAISGAIYDIDISALGNVVRPVYEPWTSSGFTGTDRVRAGEAVIWCNVTDATPTRLTSDGTAASTTNIPLIGLSNAYIARIRVVARQNAGTGINDTASWDVLATFRRGSAGTVALVGGGGSAIAPTHNDSGAAAWRLDVDADNTNKGIGITFTGETAKTIRVAAHVLTTEVAL